MRSQSKLDRKHWIERFFSRCVHIPNSIGNVVPKCVHIPKSHSTLNRKHWIKRLSKVRSHSQTCFQSGFGSNVFAQCVHIPKSIPNISKSIGIIGSNVFQSAFTFQNRSETLDQTFISKCLHISKRIGNIRSNVFSKCVHIAQKLEWEVWRVCVCVCVCVCVVVCDCV